MMPVLRRTWAPCGATPTLAVRTRHHEKVSGIGALIVSPRRRHVTLALALYPRLNIRGPQVRRLHPHLAPSVGRTSILAWGHRAPAHPAVAPPPSVRPPSRPSSLHS